MTELSPAAQAIDFALYGPGLGATRRQIAAAVLRAADEELASCLFVGPDEGDVKRVIDVSDLHDLIAELEAQ
jgi:hypothetical protein